MAKGGKKQPAKKAPAKKAAPKKAPKKRAVKGSSEPVLNVKFPRVVRVIAGFALVAIAIVLLCLNVAK